MYYYIYFIKIKYINNNFYCLIILPIIITYIFAYTYIYSIYISLKSLGYICSNSQKYIVRVKITDFSLMAKIIRKLIKDHVP